MEKSFCFSFTRYNYRKQQHAPDPHTHTHTQTLGYKHHGTFCASFVWRGWGTRQRQRGTAGELGERGQACQLDFFMGEFSDLCALFLLFFFLFVFLLFFLFFGVFFLCFRFHCYPHRSFVAVLFFRFNWRQFDSRKNFIMKLNRCQFIRLETRQYLELSAISLSPLCLSLFFTTRVHSKICRHLLCIFYDSFPLYLPPFFAAFSTMPARLICRYKSLSHLEPLCGTFVASKVKTLSEIPTLCASVATRLQAPSS